MTRGARVAVAAVAAALLAVPAGRAAADGLLPVPSWQPSGPVVKGASNTADAPPLAAGQSYRDSIVVGETKYYSVSLDDTSSAYLSAFAVPRPGAPVRYSDGLKLVLANSGDVTCDSYLATFHWDGAARPVGGYAARTVEPNGPCRQAGAYTLAVTRIAPSAATAGAAGTATQGDRAAWPLEIRYVSEPGLRAGSAAQPTPTGYATPSPAPVTGTARPAEGGTGFDDAAGLRGGVWKDKVLPGQTRFYKVPVSWGRQVAFTADFANAGGDGFDAEGIRVEAYNPARGFIDDRTAAYSGRPASAVVQTAPVVYANRFVSDQRVAAARFAGYYYVAVSVDPKVAEFVSGSVAVTLRVGLGGSADPAPAYAGDAASAGFGITAKDLGSANGTPGGADDRALRTLAYAAFGTGTLLVLWVVVWVTAARRRARSRHAVPPRHAVW